jgi:putative transposase
MLNIYIHMKSESTMARLPRIVIPGCPHHVLQRGNRRQTVFFSDFDKYTYIEYLRNEIIQYEIDIWAYCIMDNHVHLVAVPKHIDSLAKGIGSAHRSYTRMINSREGWRGYLWQGRFLSCPLDRKHLFAAVRYIERNPVRAGLVGKPEDYMWSSARAHIYKTNDILLSDTVFIEQIDNWREYLQSENELETDTMIRENTLAGRPLGNDQFINELEQLTGRKLIKMKPGPKTKIEKN